MTELDMKEKLVELLIASPGLSTTFGFKEEFAENADWLIAHGVGFVTDNNVGSKWIPVTERKPDLELVEAKAEDADVYPCLATIKHRMAKGGRYVGKVFYDGELFTNGDCYDLTDEVTHWMPLPQPPKGE